ncbi:uncharacterized protein MYCGRDRAFT_44003, partial [Zymoseptoria tritici IPO323]
PTLDIILSRLPNPAHSEFNGITKLLYTFILEHVLTTKGKEEYRRTLRRFVYPPS